MLADADPLRYLAEVGQCVSVWDRGAVWGGVAQCGAVWHSVTHQPGAPAWACLSALPLQRPTGPLSALCTARPLNPKHARRRPLPST